MLLINSFLKGSYSVKDKKTLLYNFYSLLLKNMKNYTISIWLNDKDSKNQEINTLDAYKIATNLIIKYFWWGTINEGKWVYTHDDWTIVIENTLICSICTSDSIENFIKDAKAVFNQESLMVQEIISKVSFE